MAAETKLGAVHKTPGPVGTDGSAAWSATRLQARLRVLRRIRHRLAEDAHALADAMPHDLSRTRADTFAAEVLPLLAACKFLEHEAVQILAPRRLGRSGLPFWLSGVDATVERVALGTILIVAPANYPLFLPGVQALQALAAGNAVVWKPGRGGGPIARLFESLCAQAGLPAGTLRVTNESVEAVSAEISLRPDKVIFTGSSEAGRAVQHLAAEASIPVVAELSGCDAVFVLPSAETARVVDAICFGMRLNGSATCMAPRRLLLVGETDASLLGMLEERFAAMDPIFIRHSVREEVVSLLADARSRGATVIGEVGDVSMKPGLVLGGTFGMAVANADISAPILTVLVAADANEAARLEQACAFGLTASIFGEESAARELGARLKVGTVIVNDLIVPTADPRIPFGGRRGSGFGVTRGTEGLLEMTAIKTTTVRRGKDRRHFQPTSAAHEELFQGVIAASHRASWGDRVGGLRRIMAAVRNLR